MIYSKPMDEQVKKKLHRESYELEKADLTKFHKEQGYDESTLNEFLVASLKQDYEEELKEDKLM